MPPHPRGGLYAAHPQQDIRRSMPGNLTPDEMVSNGFDAVSRMDFPAALEWYVKAARAGSAAGAMSAAGMYETAMGTPKNRDKARKFYKQAARRGIDAAKPKLKEFYLKKIKQRTAWFSIFILIYIVGQFFVKASFEDSDPVIYWIVAMALVGAVTAALSVFWPAIRLILVDWLYHSKPMRRSPDSLASSRARVLFRSICRAVDVSSTAAGTVFVIYFGGRVLSELGKPGAWTIAITKAIALAGLPFPSGQLTEIFYFGVVAVIAVGIWRIWTTTTDALTLSIQIGISALMAIICFGSALYGHSARDASSTELSIGGLAGVFLLLFLSVLARDSRCWERIRDWFRPSTS